MDAAQNTDTGLARTFEERGVAVPFETKQLVGARLRIYDRKKELSTARMPETGLRYVIGLTSAEKAFSLCVNDRMLIKMLSEKDDVSPGIVRESVRRMALEGVYGEARKEAAGAETQSLQETAMSVFIRLLIRASDEVGHKIKDMSILVGTQSREVVDQIIVRIAGDRREAGQTLYDNMTDWGQILAETGLSGDRSHLRSIRNEVVDFSRQIKIWSESRPIEESNLAFQIAEFAEEVVALCDRHLKLVDDCAMRVGGCLSKWDQVRPALLKSVQSLDWTLDGWNEIIFQWRAAVETDRRREALFEIAASLPLLPKEAITSEAAEKRDAFAERVRKRVVTANHDWLTGEHSESVMGRLSRLRDRTRARVPASQ